MIRMKDIIREGHPTLRKRSEEVKFPLSEEIRKLGGDLLEYVVNSQDDELAEKHDLRPGVGIAAPQINRAQRIFVLHFDDSTGENLSMVAVNPKIVSHSVEKSYLAAGEGCLSVDRVIPGYVPRYARVTVKAFNLDGEEIKMRLKGLPAIAFQHELDHLNGVMFFDHIDSKNPFAEIENAIAIERDSAE
ncbi:peptide deformylase 2 [Planococcus antarcticus DSM 14505]|uniref:Peptide deformylase n=1 Tax=Planococcus antarcticus DSM 14505 TaxID=1185653 RepID=A0A1C7DFU1_9BACL|nr:peptide deformylase [Planococcus antarcticus]ANU10419.1 peptide deformylase [Planococcus antarcticus DSM 14505]EIM08595.1 peptide deformylase 2 [Planococcus antarcticus DSM 14505]